MSVTPLAGVWIEINDLSELMANRNVTPLAGVWIEICWFVENFYNPQVTPLAGVWIEMCLTLLIAFLENASLPLRECGLKYPM